MAPLGNLALVPLCEMVVVPVGLAGADRRGASGRRSAGGRCALAAAAARLALAIAGGFRAHAPVWVCRAPERVRDAPADRRRRAGARRPGRARAAAALAVAAAVACAVVAGSSLVVRELRRRFTDALTVTFLDVGQGDAAVIEAPGRLGRC